MKRPGFVVDFSKGGAGAAGGGRLDAPSFHRNHRPILDVLGRHLADRTGHVLEIGSGTGQHAAEFAAALPRLTWWPSDPDDAHLASIAAWRSAAGIPNLMPPFRLDVLDEDWRLGEASRPPAAGLTAIVAVNVLHIAPWRVAVAILGGARRHLAGDGLLFLYGPFKRDGAHTARSNAAFDLALRNRDPEWGVRDIGEVEAEARRAGLGLVDIAAMPANNLTLVLSRGGSEEQGAVAGRAASARVTASP